MNFLKFIKHIFFFLLTFLLGAQTTYAKTELVLPQNQVSFSIEKDQIFYSLEKQVQPNISFLKEKSRFVLSESVSAQNHYDFSEKDVSLLGKAGGDIWTTIAKQVDDLISPKVNQIKNIYSDSKVGYRGSLATGQKYNNGNPLPFDANDFDVDGFIVSDQLAAKIGNKPFRNAREIPQLNTICDDLDSSFINNLPGYRTEIGKPFTLRVYTEAEFLQTVQPNGFKLFD